MTDKRLTEDGRCTCCGNRVKGWKPPFGPFAPEAFETLREYGIDPTSGHKATCRYAYEIYQYG